jgi:hypothetical protein
MSNVEKEPGPQGDVPEKQEGSVTPPTEEKKKREYKEFSHDEAKATREFFVVLAVVVIALNNDNATQTPTWICQPYGFLRASARFSLMALRF